jgi:ABC-type multidrug transport system ATPase subunit
MAVINHGEIIAQGSVSELLEREPTDYSIQASPHPLAVKRMESLPWVKVISAENEKIEVHVEPGHSSELVRFLVTNGIEIFSYTPHRTLEGFFLRITEGMSEI